MVVVQDRTLPLEVAGPPMGTVRSQQLKCAGYLIWWITIIKYNLKGGWV